MRSHTQGPSPTLARSTGTPRRGTLYTVPHDAIRLHTDSPAIYALAGRLWDRDGDGNAGPSDSLQLVLEGTPPGRDVTHEPLLERWTVGPDEAELVLAGALHAHIDCARGSAHVRVVDRLVEEDPGLVTRLALETPVGAMLARRGYAVLHAGAVVGPLGAVVIRGAPGAGKSTLVAAAHRAGFTVLGDETILAARNDPDDLLAAVRDVTLLPDAARLLGLDTTPAVGREGKRRVDLPPTSPAGRRARRVATVLLGSRDGVARLDALTPEVFLDEFPAGAIPQERWSGTPSSIAARWARRGAFRLRGAADLDGAVGLLAELVGAGAEARA